MWNDHQQYGKWITNIQYLRSSLVMTTTWTTSSTSKNSVSILIKLQFAILLILYWVFCFYTLSLVLWFYWLCEKWVLYREQNCNLFNMWITISFFEHSAIMLNCMVYWSYLLCSYGVLLATKIKLCRYRGSFFCKICRS